LKKRSAVGPDGIHNLLIINSTIEFSELILKLFNQSAEKGYIPQDWKIANVTMIPKKQVKSENPKDYRP
jgi:hypothetical protein